MLLSKWIKIILFNILFIFFISIFFKYIYGVSNEIQFDTNEWVETFYEIAKTAGSDKVSTHHYESIYGQYLYPIRNNKISFLEIGLGCDMNYGPGKSLILWKKFLPKASINVLEFDKNCALNFSSQVNNMFTGDQADFKILDKVSKKGPYDVIIDDGGHSRKQQINSLIGLWPHLKSKGFYFIEDIFTSFLKRYNDNPSETAIDVIFQLIILLNESSDIKAETILPKEIPISNYTKVISKDLLFVSCFQRVCVLAKK